MVKTPRCNCGATNSLFSLIGKKWVLFILRAVHHDAHSFTEIRHAVGEANTKILTDRLTELVAEGILTKDKDNQYTLTQLGTKLAKKILEVAQWWGDTKEPNLSTSNTPPKLIE